MRDFRDAKAMAQTLRDSLSTKALTISHSESLELVSKMFGAADWNTLSALIQAGRGAPATAPAAAQQAEPARTYPAMPIRDLVPFPSATFPLFVGRPKSVQALDHAFERQREVVLVVQKDSAVDFPAPVQAGQLIIQYARQQHTLVRLQVYVAKRGGLANCPARDNSVKHVGIFRRFCHQHAIFL